MIIMATIFFIGYFLITIEHYTKVNKSAIALLMAILCWIAQFKNGEFISQFDQHLIGISQIVFFILGALSIVELISAHKGFSIISNLISVGFKRRLLWITCLITFFLSAVLDNLTTTIVMVTLLMRLIPKGEDRLLIGSGIVVAANAGGAWTPIGDVTTTMLWIGGQISTLSIMSSLFLPSFVCFAIATLGISYYLKGEFKTTDVIKENIEPKGELIFILGICSLIFVPIFKLITGLPPFMGVLFGLGSLWLISDLLHKKYEERFHLRMPHVLSKIDLSGALFFLGILLCVGALETSGLLHQFAASLSASLPNLEVVAIVLGLVSAVVDNVPLVAAAMSMYDVKVIAQDHSFWQMVAYAAGTGGSLLIIGSAAGVVFMGLEKVDFIWYAKKITLPAAMGFFAGIGVLYLQNMIF